MKVKTDFSSLTAFESQEKETLLIKLFFHKKEKKAIAQVLTVKKLTNGGQTKIK
jgi:hypothetical protein